MKKFIIGAFLLFSTLYVKADQLAYISLDQAEKAVKHLKKQKDAVLWCACCTNDSKTFITITGAYYKKVKDYADENGNPYYGVFITGINKNGDIVETDVDLAYIHTKKKKKYRSVGELLGFDCDPCTSPFTL